MAAAGLALPMHSLEASAIMQKVDSSELEDELIIVGRGLPLLTDRSERATGHNSVKFQMDVCGTLERPGSNALLANRGGFDEGMSDSDNPLDEAKLLIGRWL